MRENSIDIKYNSVVFGCYAQLSLKSRLSLTDMLYRSKINVYEIRASN